MNIKLKTNLKIYFDDSDIDIIQLVENKLQYVIEHENDRLRPKSALIQLIPKCEMKEVQRERSKSATPHTQQRRPATALQKLQFKKLIKEEKIIKQKVYFKRNTGYKPPRINNNDLHYETEHSFKYLETQKQIKQINKTPRFKYIQEKSTILKGQQAVECLFKQFFGK